MTRLRRPRTADAQSPLELYLREINDTPLLTADEEKGLARRILEGDTSARDHMVRANLRLVVNVARGSTGRGLCLQDLIEDLAQQLVRFVVTEILGPFAKRTISGDFVVLDCLTGSKKASIEGRALCFLHQTVSLLEQPFDRVALFAGRLLADGFEDLLQFPDLLLRFRKMLLGRLLQLTGKGSIAPRS